MTRTILRTFTIFGIIAAASISQVHGKQRTAINTVAADEAAIREQAAQYARAFSDRKADVLARMWTTDGILIDAQGVEWKGRDAIQKQFEKGFRDDDRSSLAVSIRTLTFPAPNVAVEEGTCAITKAQLQMSSCNYSAVHVKQNGVWSMLQVAEEKPTINVATVNDLSWLVGDWSAVVPDSKSLQVSANWDLQHHFLRFGSRDNVAGDKSGQYQLVGLDPTSHQLVSFHFDSTGGYGKGEWCRDGNKWYERTAGVLSDGRRTRAVYVLDKLSEDKFTWRSTQRYIEDTPLPDTQQITVNRIK